MVFALCTISTRTSFVVIARFVDSARIWTIDIILYVASQLVQWMRSVRDCWIGSSDRRQSSLGASRILQSFGSFSTSSQDCSFDSRPVVRIAGRQQYICETIRMKYRVCICAAVIRRYTSVCRSCSPDYMTPIRAPGTRLERTTYREACNWATWTLDITGQLFSKWQRRFGKKENSAMPTITVR